MIRTAHSCRPASSWPNCLPTFCISARSQATTYRMTKPTIPCSSRKRSRLRSSSACASSDWRRLGKKWRPQLPTSTRWSKINIGVILATPTITFSKVNGTFFELYICFRPQLCYDVIQSGKWQWRLRWKYHNFPFHSILFCTVATSPYKTFVHLLSLHVPHWIPMNDCSTFNC